MEYYLIIIIIILLLFSYCNSEGFHQPHCSSDCNATNDVKYTYPQYYNGPLKRNALDFPIYPLPMPDRYEFGRMFFADAPTISYKPGYW